MAVASDTQATVDISVIAWILGAEGDDALMQQYESLRGLECRSGGISGHDRTVVERLVGVGNEFAVIRSALPADKYVGVVGGTRDEAEDLACGRLDSHDCTFFIDHQRLGILLKLDVERQADVASADGGDIARAVLIATLNLTARVADEYLLTFLSPQEMFVAFLDAEVAGVVAGGVFGIGVDIALRHLADVAKDIGSDGIAVLPENAFLNEQTGEAVELFLKAAIVLGRQMGEQPLRRVA